jgi:hypothetical protein
VLRGIDDAWDELGLGPDPLPHLISSVAGTCASKKPSSKVVGALVLERSRLQLLHSCQYNNRRVPTAKSVLSGRGGAG